MNGRRRILATLLLILLLTAGCATLRVDVDVYKGPMSNHEDVQIEQMAVMAIGAKPVLLQLRDDPDVSKKKRLLARVDAILKLYGDRKLQVLNSYLDDALQLFDEFKKTDSSTPSKEKKRLLSAILDLALDVIIEVNNPRLKGLVDQRKVTDLATDVALSILKIGSFENALKKSEITSGTDDQRAALKRQLSAAKQYKAKKSELDKWFKGRPIVIAGMLKKVQEKVDSNSLVLLKPDGKPLMPTMEDRLTELGSIVSGLGFEKGRLDDGLETLIENYLRSKDKCLNRELGKDAVCNNDDNCIKEGCDEERARRRLRDALVRFSEKILVIANHHQIFKNSDDVDEEGAEEKKSKRRLDRYVLVLQAIGNSILNQADELTHSKDHQLRLEHQQASEHQALEQAAKAVTDYTAPAGGKNQREVLDDLIAFLRYDLVLATRKDGDAGRAGQIEKALKLALEHRASMIHIRPPSAYLRSSFAATGLQDDSRIRWTNMLGERGLIASVPYFGEKYVNREDKYRIQVLESIDKQYWQNINSVRVSGGGDTNYAIAKDDIGNWYVKSFSADPTPIIRGAQRMALFAEQAAVQSIC